MKKMFFSIALASVLIACGEKSKEAKTEIDTEKVKEEAIVDSIKKAEQAKIDDFRKDSIAELQIKGYLVKKISGKDESDEKTKIEYKSLFQVLNEVRERAKKEMWTDEELKHKLEEYKDIFKGGMIQLNIERITIGSGNTSYFSIIVKDSKDNEILRRTLPDNIPSYRASSDIWSNIAVESIDKKVETPFYIYVVDKLADEPFKFEVTSIKK